MKEILSEELLGKSVMVHPSLVSCLKGSFSQLALVIYHAGEQHSESSYRDGVYLGNLYLHFFGSLWGVYV